MKKAIATAAILVILSTNQVSLAATASIAVTAKVFTALTVTQTQPMSFGNLYVTNGSSSTSQASGAFQIAGEKSATVSIDYPSSVTLAGPGASSLNVNITSTDENDTLHPGLGTLTKNINGEVTVNGTTTAGDYSGTATITVAYV
ncbi:hypothetical protein PsalN5692_03851 (plasmid) [Piscirickettsia salmonis]|uniref:DUF4402 domain-containing protein n=1 Tax=Piscirickettsia salmonis TaxID=1238 RepID=UPI0012B7A195|nr:DUF4402 domain-containing protein [Piscirickettsia salmonis]QGP52342.1 hypothetical protein PsalN5692_03851 [Piscirickettsia salmonis]